jgi:hypothetical protein
LKNSLRAVHGCTAIFQARFMCLKNGTRQKPRFLLCELKKAMDGFFNILWRRIHSACFNKI